MTASRLSAPAHGWGFFLPLRPWVAGATSAVPADRLRRLWDCVSKRLRRLTPFRLSVRGFA